MAREGRRVGFVATMGCLHEGHLQLVDVARQHTDTIVMSIFVNPLQFGPGEDFERYPSDIDRDRSLAAARGVDCLFVPEVSAMYHPDSTVRVTEDPVATTLEGQHRPGHFEGVLTVMAKLFNIVEPSVAVFGRKDVQQAALICRMVRDLDFGVHIVVAPTVREPDGLALSSRNVYLSPEERETARTLSQALQAIAGSWQAGETRGWELKRVGQAFLEKTAGLAIDYIAVVDPDTFEPVHAATASSVVALAALVGSTRLIDNIILGEGLNADATASR